MTYYIAAAWLCCALANAGLLRERDRTLSVWVAQGARRLGGDAAGGKGRFDA